MDFLFYELFVGKPVWLWLMFLTHRHRADGFDLGVLHKDDHELGVAESLKLSAFYIFIAILFISRASSSRRRCRSTTSSSSA
jgi:tellurite resistance protein TerC